MGMVLGFGQPVWAGIQLADFRFLSSGSPGCFEWIRSRAAGPAEVARLPETCQQMRQDYHRILEVLHRDRRGVLGKVEKALRLARSDRSPYEAILFAVLLKDRSLLPALREREKLERKRKLRFRYAEAAIGRIERGSCPGDLGRANELRELCLARDSVLAEAGVSP